MLGIVGGFGIITWAVQSIDPQNYDASNTGVFLDTLENEVKLVYEEGKPSYYYCPVFTPVCETGECKPIHIHFFWDLMGNYQRFEVPQGKELTKLDHKPFSEEDYELLDEILKGSDPRYGQLVKGPSYSESKSNAEQQAEGNSSEGSPSPSQASVRAVFLKKTEMVDGISGATLPELTGQFVPGALYTTYTCWDLANTSRLKMAEYSRRNLFQEENAEHFLSVDQTICRESFILELARKSAEENGRTNVLMSILDTASGELAIYAVQSLEYQDLELDTVQDVLFRSFLRKDDPELKREIIQKWRSGNMKPIALQELAGKIYEEKELRPSIIQLFQDQSYWPKGVVGTLCRQMILVKNKEEQQLIHDVIAKRRGIMSRSEWKLLSHIRKEYDLDKYRD